MTPGQDILVAWTYHCSMFTTEFLSGFEPPLDLYMFFHIANCNVDEGQWTAHTHTHTLIHSDLGRTVRLVRIPTHAILRALMKSSAAVSLVGNLCLKA